MSVADAPLERYRITRECTELDYVEVLAVDAEDAIKRYMEDDPTVSESKSLELTGAKIVGVERRS